MPIRLLVKIIYNAKIGTRWKESEAIKKLELDENKTIYEWTGYWNRQKESKGAKCNSMKINTKRSMLTKCLVEKLPTMKKLNKRKPQIYDTMNCRVCSNEVEETQDHLAKCEYQKHLWK